MVWSGTAISLLLVLFRLYVRIKSFKKFYVDDAFVLASWVMLLATAIIWQCVGGDFYQLLAVLSGELQPLPPTFATDSQMYLRASVAIFVLFYSCLWSVKLSF